jgi:alcohol dehydrogenase
MSDPNIPLIVAPTTAGSGSEATHFAVVYIGQDKYSVASQRLLPEIVILDCKLIATGSGYHKACNGLDALAQGIESAWAAGSTDASRANAFEAISLCMNYHSAVVANDKSEIALQGILDGANKAGQAINISKTTAAHAWSYGITSQHGIPHGHAVWLTLPMIFHIHANSDSSKVTDPRGVDHFRSIMDRLMDALSVPSSDQAYEYMKKYVVSLGVESEMANVGAATRQQRQMLSEQVNMERMSNNPIYLNESDKSLIFKL